ncbi:MAG TPA: sigma-70 family RNA polymerase sigma factor [Flavobacterium sp.]|uniref:sigma-70 family RNA polymerase sigma factor n=1 Tax=Flavobacterium sp. TaxID=239 RepID=UPI002C527259|nr:sigma-70 family RNA polymerase sigma factor [Flavobacterium sp.]HSD13811.1 sigma-70 family RNA polymerase sigma factor [Flavobacterium sp.]
MQQSDKLSETEIIDRVLKGEKLLYELIVRRFNSYLYKIGRSYNYNHEDTQDLMQDTYIDAYKSLSQFKNHSNFKTWLIRIMLNNCFRKKEKFSFKNEFAKADLNENVTPMFTNSNNDANKNIHNRELGRVIEESLSKIPEEYRMVFSLREISGLNVSETADLLNISQANVKVRLNRAKVMLREQLEKSYSTSELFEFNLIYCDALTANVMQKINEL